MENFKHNTFIRKLQSFEKTAWKYHIKLKTKKPVIISISGTSGTGKSTLAKNLYKYFKKRFKRSKVALKESGKIYREIAKKSGFRNDLISFSKKVSSKNKDIDMLVDKKMLAYGYNLSYIYNNRFKKQEYDYIVAVGRLANLVLGKNAILRIFLVACIDEIARRISKDRKRDEHGLDKNKIKKMILKRDEADLKRYKKIYGIKNYILRSMAKSNIIIDTTDMSKKETLEVVLSYIKLLNTGNRLKEVGIKNARFVYKKLYMKVG